MTVLLDPMMYFGGGLLVSSSLASLVLIILSLRINSKRIKELEIQTARKYISKKDIVVITDKIESQVSRIEKQVELLTEIK